MHQGKTGCVEGDGAVVLDACPVLTFPHGGPYEGRSGHIPELQRLHAGRAPAVLAFERANRACFAASVPDRGNAFFDRFADRFDALPAERGIGVCAFHVLVADDRMSSDASSRTSSLTRRLGPTSRGGPTPA